MDSKSTAPSIPTPMPTSSASQSTAVETTVASQTETARSTAEGAVGGDRSATPKVTPTERTVQSKQEVSPDNKPAEITLPELTDEQFAVLISKNRGKIKEKLKIDGQEVELSLDELRKVNQLEKASYKTMQEAAAEKKRLAAVVENFKKDPISALRDPNLGLNARQIAEQILTQELEAELLTPEQRQTKEMERELNKMRAEKQAEIDRQKAAEQAKADEAEFNRYLDGIAGALKAAKLPYNSFNVRQMAYHIENMENMGLTDDVFNLAANELYKETNNTYTSNAKDLEGEALVKFLGDDIVKKIRDYDKSQMKSLGVTPKVTKSALLDKPKDMKPKKTWEDFIKGLEKK